MILRIGERLGPYEIVSLIGAGGMGRVYKARDTRLNRVVAIKIITEFSKESNIRIRFKHEAKLIAGLNHPRICTLYDVGQAQGIDYLVMEFLDGETLAKM